jgi:hypothetical protein
VKKTEWETSLFLKWRPVHNKEEGDCWDCGRSLMRYAMFARVWRAVDGETAVTFDICPRCAKEELMDIHTGGKYRARRLERGRMLLGVAFMMLLMAGVVGIVRLFYGPFFGEAVVWGYMACSIIGPGVPGLVLTLRGRKRGKAEVH